MRKPGPRLPLVVDPVLARRRSESVLKDLPRTARDASSDSPRAQVLNPNVAGRKPFSAGARRTPDARSGLGVGPAPCAQRWGISLGTPRIFIFQRMEGEVAFSAPRIAARWTPPRNRSRLAKRHCRGAACGLSVARRVVGPASGARLRQAQVSVEGAHGLRVLNWPRGRSTMSMRKLTPRSSSSQLAAGCGSVRVQPHRRAGEASRRGRWSQGRTSWQAAPT